MTTAKEIAKQQVATLVTNYQGLSYAQKNPYLTKEENTKKDYILPLFRALGWNVENVQEVYAEYNASKGRVDYAFALGGVCRFLVEVKHIEADLTDTKSITQALGYALHKGVTWTVLTSFTDLHMFYALGEANKPDMLRWKTLNYTDYLTHFDDLWLLSRSSIESGQTDKTARLEGHLPPRLPIEKRLFRQFRQWREKLTNDLLQYHSGILTDSQVDQVIEILFNRLIFIRNCEDRNIEERLLWQAVQNSSSKRNRAGLVSAVRRIFLSFREWYDSELFPNTPHLLDNPDLVHLDDDPLETVIRGLYSIPGGYGEYDFSIIDADVLGAVYEQYLGHVSQVARERVQAKSRQLTLIGMETPIIEFVEKRAKRKKQGIYYTPKWVVDYIVQQTLGKLLDEASQKDSSSQLQIQNLRILDPACGSGSFLIRVYDEILKRASLHSNKQNLMFSSDPKAILKNCIFGVDLDPQAVDIARLNLMLRGLVKREPLPELKDNVQVGNSLISGEESELQHYFGSSWEDKKAFSWAEHFTFLNNHGGFDVIVGNPPYYNVETLGKESPDVAWLKSHFTKIWMDKSDILFYFIARSIQLLKGRMAFIVSRAFIEADKAQNLRQYILDTCAIDTIIDFRDFRVFEDVNIACAIIVLRRESDQKIRSKSKIRVAQVHVSEEDGADLMRSIETKFNSTREYSDEKFSTFTYPQKLLSNKPWSFSSKKRKTILSRIDGKHPKLGQLCLVGEGMQTGANEAFQVKQNTINAENLEIKYLKKRAINSDIMRYHIVHSGSWLIWVESFTDFTLCPERIANHLTMHKKVLKSRAAYIRGNCEWFKFTWPLHVELYKQPKLISSYRAPYNAFALDNTSEYIGLTDTTVIFQKPDDPHDIKYYLALLNSKLLTYRFKSIGKPTGSGMYEFFKNSINQLPIRIINFNESAERATHDTIVRLVERMISIQNHIASKSGIRDHELEALEKEARHIDKHINIMVYGLYDISDDEISIINEDS